MAEKKPTMRVTLKSISGVKLTPSKPASAPQSTKEPGYEKTATISMRIKRGSLKWQNPPSNAGTLRVATPEQSLFTMDLTKGKGASTSQVFNPGSSSVIDSSKLVNPPASQPAQPSINEETPTIQIPNTQAQATAHHDAEVDAFEQRLQEALQAQSQSPTKTDSGKASRSRDSQTLNPDALQAQGPKQSAPVQPSPVQPTPVRPKAAQPTSTQISSDSGKVKTDSGKVKTDSGKVKTDSGKVKTDSGKVKTDSGKTKLSGVKVRRKKKRKSRTRMNPVVTRDTEPKTEVKTDSTKIVKPKPASSAAIAYLIVGLILLIVGVAGGLAYYVNSDGNRKKPGYVTKPTNPGGGAHVSAVPPKVTALYLYNPETGKDIRQIESSDDIDFYKLGGEFTIRAEVTPAKTGCVTFYWKSRIVHVDKEPPYTLTKDGDDGRPASWDPGDASGLVNVIPHAGADQTRMGASMRKFITIENSRGLRGQYFKNRDFQGKPYSRFDKAIYFSWKGQVTRGLPSDNFSCRWIGKLAPPRSGKYKMELEMNDYGRMWIAGKEVVKMMKGKGACQLDLEKGKHYPIIVEHVEYSGSAHAKLIWSGPGIKRAYVPSSVLRPVLVPLPTKPVPKTEPPKPEQKITSGHGLRGEYFNTPDFKGAPIVRLDPEIDFNWLKGPPIAGVGVDNFSCRWTGFVIPPVTGKYEIRLEVDDRGSFYLGKNKLIDDRGKDDENKAAIDLEKGRPYPITIEHIEDGYGASAHFYWTPPGGNSVIVPASALRPAKQTQKPQAPSTKVNGLRGEYFSNREFKGTPKVRIDPQIQFRWGLNKPIDGVPNDRFSVRWTGSIAIRRDGRYRFELHADNRGELQIDDKVLIPFKEGESAATIDLKKGRYPIQVRYIEDTGAALIQLFWSGPGFNRQFVSPRALFPEVQQPPTLTGDKDFGLRGEYFDNAELKGEPITRVDPMINFDWGGGHPIKGVKADGFSCRWTGAIIPPKRGDYEFLLKADDSGSLTIDGKEVIVDSNYRETKTGKIYLDPSKRHNILITQRDTRRDACAELYWTPPGGKQSLVPSNALRPPPATIEKAPAKEVEESGWIKTKESKAPLREHNGYKEISRNATYKISHPTDGYKEYISYLLSPGTTPKEMEFAFHSEENAKEPSITIKLDKTYSVRHIIIHNRRGSCQERANGLTAWTSTDGKKWKQVWQGKRAQPIWDIPIEGGVNAAYIKLGLPGNASFHLYRVIVFGD